MLDAAQHVALPQGQVVLTRFFACSAILSRSQLVSQAPLARTLSTPRPTAARARPSRASSRAKQAADDSTWRKTRQRMAVVPSKGSAEQQQGYGDGGDAQTLCASAVCLSLPYSHARTHTHSLSLSFVLESQG